MPRPRALFGRAVSAVGGQATKPISALQIQIRRGHVIAQTRRAEAMSGGHDLQMQPSTVQMPLAVHSRPCQDRRKRRKPSSKAYAEAPGFEPGRGFEPPTALAVPGRGVRRRPPVSLTWSSACRRILADTPELQLQLQPRRCARAPLQNLEGLLLRDAHSTRSSRSAATTDPTAARP